MAYLIVYFDGNETPQESEDALTSMLYLAKRGHKIELKWGTPENPVHVDTMDEIPTFNINDMVVATESLTSDNAYMIPGSRESLFTPYIVLQNQQGVIEKMPTPGVHREYKVNFGAAGIWSVRPEFLKLRP